MGDDNATSSSSPSHQALMLASYPSGSVRPRPDVGARERGGNVASQPTMGSANIAAAPHAVSSWDLAGH